MAVKSGPRVRISPAAPKKQTSLLGRLFFYPGEIRIEDRQPPGAAGSSGPARTIPLYPPLRRICRRISPAAPKKQTSLLGRLFFYPGEIRIEDRQPPGAAGSSGPVRTIPLYPPLRRICRRISSCCASSPGAAGSSGPARTTRRRRGRHIVRGDFLQKSPLTHFVAAPLQIEPAALGFDLVLGAAADYRHRAPVFHRSSKIIFFPCFCAYRSVVYAPPKSRHIIAIK